MMRGTWESHALKDNYYLLCGGRKALQILRTLGAKGQGREGRGVVTKGVGLTARRVGCTRKDKAREAAWEESLALMIMNE